METRSDRESRGVQVPLAQVTGFWVFLTRTVSTVQKRSPVDPLVSGLHGYLHNPPWVKGLPQDPTTPVLRSQEVVLTQKILLVLT